MTDKVAVANPLIGEEERAAVDRVLRSGGLAQGPEVADFESEFSAQVVAHRPCVATNSGTSSLHLGLAAAGVTSGDEVVVPSFTFAATANAVALTGATPVFVDIDPVTFCLDPKAFEAAVTPRTRGVVPVHLFGHPADMPGIEKVATRHGVEVFEDAAQAHGAALDGRPVGTFGRLAMFSFYPTKNMTAGEGGMTVCADELTADRVRLLRNQGMKVRYQNEIVGHNARMTDINAAIGRVQLGRLNGWNEQRRANARFLNDHLEGVSVPAVTSGAVHVYHQYTIRVLEDRDGFARALDDEYGVQSGVYYPVPVHRLPAYDADIDLPATRDAADQVLSLPVHPGLTEADLDRVATAVNAVAKAGA